MMYRLVLFGLCIFLIFSMTGSSLTFTGSLLEQDVSPGEEISHKIIISLSGNETTMQAIGGIYGYGMGLDGSRIPQNDSDEMAPYSAAGFLKLVPQNATIEPGKPAEFIIEGRVPKDVGSGGRYALAEIHTPPQGNGQIGIALATIAPIRLTISGTDLIETGNITSVNASRDNVSIIFKNTGNHHFKASAKATLKDEAKKVVASSEAPLMSTALVPTASWLFKMPFDLGANLNPGTYTVSVSVIHENGSVLDTVEKTFKV